MIDVAFEDLSQALRVLLESYFRAHTQELLLVDRAEAVGNMENAFTSVLNAFHSLYDAIQKEVPGHPVDWYADPALCTLLAMRNAKHHNKSKKIRNVYNYHVQTCEKPQDSRKYVLVDFPAGEEGGDTFEFYISWADLEDFLSLPRSESRLRVTAKPLIEGYLSAQQFPTHAVNNATPVTSVFINAVPLLVNGAAAIVPSIKGHLKPLSTESQFFMWHFATTQAADTSKHEVKALSLALPS